MSIDGIQELHRLQPEPSEFSMHPTRRATITLSRIQDHFNKQGKLIPIEYVNGASRWLQKKGETLKETYKTQGFENEIIPVNLDYWREGVRRFDLFREKEDSPVNAIFISCFKEIPEELNETRIDRLIRSVFGKIAPIMNFLPFEISQLQDSVLTPLAIPFKKSSDRILRNKEERTVKLAKNVRIIRLSDNKNNERLTIISSSDIVKPSPGESEDKVIDNRFDAQTFVRKKGEDWTPSEGKKQLYMYQVFEMIADVAI